MKISEKEITEKDKFAAIAISATLIQNENPKTAEELRENLRESLECYKQRQAEYQTMAATCNDIIDFLSTFLNS